MVKNLLRKKKKKKPIEASMPLDKPEVKMVEASYDENPFFIGIGLAKKRDVKGAGGVGTEGVKGEYGSQKDLDWRVWYNPNALPSGFMPEVRLKDWMKGTVALTSGAAVTKIRFRKADSKELDRIPDPVTLTGLSGHGLLDAFSAYGFGEKEKKKTKKPNSK